MNGTRIQLVTQADMGDTELNAAYVPSRYYDVPQVKIQQYMDVCPIFLSESLLYEFLNLSIAGRGGPVFVNLLLRHDRSEQTEEWNLHFAGKCLARK